MSMTKFFRDAILSIIGFFGILMALAYYNGGYNGMIGVLADPFNWIIVAVVIGASFTLKMYRQKKEDSQEEEDSFLT